MDGKRKHGWEMETWMRIENMNGKWKHGWEKETRKERGFGQENELPNRWRY